jgi:hypothetical protein
MSMRMTGPVVLVIVVLAVLVSWSSLAAHASAIASEAAVPGQLPEPRQEQQGDPLAPMISFIQSPSAVCYRAETPTDACYINWAYLSVSATSPQYVISMTVAIDGRLVASHSGFFQSSMYVPAGFYGGGFRVSCGAPETAGIAGLGGTHTYVIRARETGGLKSANYGSVTCPAGLHHVYVPVILRLASQS